MATIYNIFPKKNTNEKGKRYTPHLKRLQKKHPLFRKIIDNVGIIKTEIPIWHSIDDAILYAVIGQMLSMAATESIISKLLSKHKNSSNIIKWASTVKNIHGPKDGLSRRKRKALSEWARYKSKSKIKDFFRRWNSMPLPQYKHEIMSIWGFGQWAADMIAIFYLGRMDVWPNTDGGIIKASRIVFGEISEKEIKQIINGSETVVALYLWEMLNRKIVIKT